MATATELATQLRTVRADIAQQAQVDRAVEGAIGTTKTALTAAGITLLAQVDALLALGNKRRGDVPPAVITAIQGVAAVLAGEVSRLGTQQTAMTTGAAVLTAQAETLARIATEVDALDDAVTPPPVDPPPVTPPGVPAGYVHLWTEDFALPRVENGRKLWKVFYQDGTDLVNAARIWQLDGSGDPDSGEGVEGSLDNRVAAIEIPDGWGQGTTGSGAPASIYSGSLGARTTVCFDMVFKMSKDYKQYQGNKIGYVYCGTKAPLFLSLEPDGPYTTQPDAEKRPIRIRWNTQGVIAPTSGINAGKPNWKCSANMGNSAFHRLTRGVFYRLRTELVMNSTGKPDGILRFWVNNEQIAEYTDVGFFGGGTATAPVFSKFAWTPTHASFAGEGYQGNAVQYMDHFSVYVKA